MLKAQILKGPDYFQKFIAQLLNLLVLNSAFLKISLKCCLMGVLFTSVDYSLKILSMTKANIFWKVPQIVCLCAMSLNACHQMVDTTVLCSVEIQT